jgi:hypothetical protein
MIKLKLTPVDVVRSVTASHCKPPLRRNYELGDSCLPARARYAEEGANRVKYVAYF